MVPQANKYQGYNVQLQKFPNIPLISSNGCINYNHVITMRQLGYPIWENHKDDNVSEFILNNGGTTHQELLRRIICAWEKVHTKENKLKGKNITTKESYTQWVKERVCLVKLHFFIDLIYCSDIPDPIHVLNEEIDHLKETDAHLEQENEIFEHNLYNASYENNPLKSNLEKKKKQLCESIVEVDSKRNKRKITLGGLISIGFSMGGLNRQLGDA